VIKEAETRKGTGCQPLNPIHKKGRGQEIGAAAGAQPVLYELQMKLDGVSAPALAMNTAMVQKLSGRGLGKEQSLFATTVQQVGIWQRCHQMEQALYGRQIKAGAPLQTR
jgi:hypothetical protein